MTAKELFEYLTQDAGLDAATADVIMKAAGNEKLNAKATSLIQKKEYDELERRAAALELSYNGTKDKPGSKAYEDWYAKNYPAIQQLQQKAALYEERYGPIDPNSPKPNATPNPQAQTFSAEDVQKIVHETIQKGGYGDRWSDLLTGTGTIVQKHMFNGRKNPIDFKKLGELAEAKYSGNLEQAYEEYDAPEREAAQKAQTESEIKRRVDEELAKRQTQQFFPAGADATPSTSGITRPNTDKKYDRNKVVEAAITGKYESAVQ